MPGPTRRRREVRRELAHKLSSSPSWSASTGEANATERRGERGGRGGRGEREAVAVGEEKRRGEEGKERRGRGEIGGYYKNSFTDSDKQKAMDLFHGIFQPEPHGPHLVTRLLTSALLLTAGAVGR
eukprot:763740-Hanusia_phi.AAC.4